MQRLPAIDDGIQLGYYCPQCKYNNTRMTKMGRRLLFTWGASMLCGAVYVLTIVTAAVPACGALALGLLGCGMMALAAKGV